MKPLEYANAFKKLKDDPLGFVVDTLIAVIVNIFAPFPLPGALVAQFKVPILGFLASLAILFFFLIMLVGTVFMSPLIVSSGYWTQFTALFQDQSGEYQADPGFSETQIPKQNPLGGSGMSFAVVTAYFLDPNYYLQFGRNHTGIDLVPSDSYYKNSQSYKDTREVIAFATINGTVRHYIDQYGGETVEITSDNGSIKVLYIHFSRVLVESGHVTAGTPVGVMGDTGNATGKHVHYEVRTKNGNNWQAVNPLNYIE
jgi:murein DD-endopeptidase MepM/ murein hydrolase activator NlpD